MRWLSAGLAGCANRHRQPLSVNQDHDLDALADPSATDAIAATLGLGKSAIDETFVERNRPASSTQRPAARIKDSKTPALTHLRNQR